MLLYKVQLESETKPQYPWQCLACRTKYQQLALDENYTASHNYQLEPLVTGISLNLVVTGNVKCGLPNLPSSNYWAIITRVENGSENSTLLFFVCIFSVFFNTPI